MEANKSAMKALLMNRVGDWGLTIGILYVYSVYQDVEYSVISGMGGVMPKEAGGYIMVMTIYILIGAIAKSAQIGKEKEKAYKSRNAGSYSNSLKSEGEISLKGLSEGILEERDQLTREKTSFGLHPGKSSKQGDNQQEVNKEFKD